MNHRSDPPELVDWSEAPPPGSRRIGVFPALALTGLLVGGFGCYPRAYYNRRDYYTCSPKYICKPVPYWPGL